MLNEACKLFFIGSVVDFFPLSENSTYGLGGDDCHPMESSSQTVHRIRIIAGAMLFFCTMLSLLAVTALVWMRMFRLI